MLNPVCQYRRETLYFEVSKVSNKQMKMKRENSIMYLFKSKQEHLAKTKQIWEENKILNMLLITAYIYTTFPFLISLHMKGN